MDSIEIYFTMNEISSSQFIEDLVICLTKQR